MAVVALDTSALMLPVELDIRLFEELERLIGDVDAIVPRAVVDELDALAERGGQEGRGATVGRELLEGRCRVVETDSGYADDAVLALATEGTAHYLVSADRPLIRRAREAGVPVIAPRGRKQLRIHPPSA